MRPREPGAVASGNLTRAGCVAVSAASIVTIARFRRFPPRRGNTINHASMRVTPALAPWLLALAAVVGGLLWHEGDRIARERAVLGIAEVGGPFRLIDQDGQARTDREFRGRYMLVYFGYTLCPDVCPATLAVMADALAKLGPRRDKIVPIFITVDPDRDAPKALKTYLAAFGPGFVGLTGDGNAVRKVAASYHVFYAKHPLSNGSYALDHTSIVYLMGPDGKFVTYYQDTSMGPDALAEDLKKRIS